MTTLSPADAAQLFRREPERFLDVGAGEVAYRRIGSSASSEIKLTAFETDHDVWVIIAGAHESDAMSTALETIALSVLAAVD